MTPQETFQYVKDHAAGWQWQRGPVGDAPLEKAQALTAKHGGWIVLVVQFSIEEQGFPPGSVGYDGTVFAPGGPIIRLPRVVAEDIWKAASRGGDA